MHVADMFDTLLRGFGLVWHDGKRPIGLEGEIETEIREAGQINSSGDHISYRRNLNEEIWTKKFKRRNLNEKI